MANKPIKLSKLENSVLKRKPSFKDGERTIEAREIAHCKVRDDGRFKTEFYAIQIKDELGAVVKINGGYSGKLEFMGRSSNYPELFLRSNNLGYYKMTKSPESEAPIAILYVNPIAGLELVDGSGDIEITRIPASEVPDYRVV